MASFGALFLELLLIRWLPTSIYYLGYFKNCILLATFLGFAAGCATRKPLRTTIGIQSLLMALLVLAVVLMENRIAVSMRASGEFFWPQFGQKGIYVSLYVVLALIFAASAVVMYPYGRLVAAYFPPFTAIHSYGINVGASLLGITAYTAVCFFQWGPVYWFALAFIPVFYFCVGRPREFVLAIIAAVLCLGSLIASQSPYEYWSPYYKITFYENDGNIYNIKKLYTNNNGHQFAYDLSPGRLAEASADDLGWQLVDVAKSNYGSSYQFLSPESVLIIGGGTGNEAAAAIRAGVPRIHVVDIDPVIIDLGRRYHPERPYDAPSVTIINDDARHYMASTKESYDLIIFGYLDSQSRLSSMSNIRLDNFVYTKESFDQARRLLTSDGVVQVTYVAYAEFVMERLYYMLDRAFNRRPLFYQSASKGFEGSIVLFAGPGLDGYNKAIDLPGLKQVRPPKGLLKYYSNPVKYAYLEPRVSTDNWPFLLVDSLFIPESYVYSLAIMLMISILFVRFTAWSRGKAMFEPRLTLLLLQGMVFMLLETSTITRMALLMGSTWVVTSLAIVLVLLSSLFAVFLVNRGINIRMNSLIGYLCLTLGLNFVVGFDAFLHLGRGVGVLLAAILVYLPIIGSSLLFVTVFKDSQDGAFHLGVNIIGAMIGGGLEYASIALGVRANYQICLVIVLVFALVHFHTLGNGGDLRTSRA